MGSQELLKSFEETVSTLFYFDLDKLRDAIREELVAEVREEVRQELLDEIRDAIREELVAEVREEVRQELLDEIRDELESAVEAANESDAPDIGTEGAWGKDDAAGLNSWLETFNQTW